MAGWIRGNNVYMASGDEWDSFSGQSSIRLGSLALVTTNGAQYTVPWQPGQAKGLNMYIATNNSTTDIDFIFHKRRYLGGTSYASRVDTTLFTVPVGESGYFCFNPGDVEKSLVSWDIRDRVGFGWKRSSATGTLLGVTIFALVEYTEEYLYDNDYVANGGINNAVGTFLNSGGY